ncbi:MAG TPA: glycosyltransferase [Dehalococcoidia bacterium]|nr:glycosyltransferase [Dehalococcoidia bacterium]
MARFLFTVWPFPGHIHPNIAVARALRERGHDVRFYTGSLARTALESEGFDLSPFRRVDEAQVEEIVLSPRGIMGQRNPLRVGILWRRWVLETVPAQLADLEGVLAEWRPDAIVCDPAMWGPFLVLHESRGVPVAILSYTAACILPGREAPLLAVSFPRARNPLARFRAGAVRAALSLVSRPVIRQASALRKAHGLPPLRVSVTQHAGTMPLYLMPSTPAFDYQRTDLPPSVRYVGPLLWNKPADQPPPAWLDEPPPDEPLVYVSEGTVPMDTAPLLVAAAEGLADLPVQVVMTTGSQRDPAALGLSNAAANVRAERWVPLIDLLPRTRLVVTTGGSGTVLAALKEGVPVLAVPTAWDQPENAWRVVDAGVGLRLSPGRCTPERLREAVQRLLTEETFREGAARMAADFRNYGGAAQAAELLEGLTCSQR